MRISVFDPHLLVLMHGAGARDLLMLLVLLNRPSVKILRLINAKECKDVRVKMCWSLFSSTH
jgi:hypothetical protein